MHDGLLHPFPLQSRAISILYMVIERYRDGDPEPVYRRFRESGRMLPDGLEYVDSWVTADRSSCFQLMRTADAGLFAQWFARWEDLVGFELVPVITSAEAAAAHVPA
jgi:hypothetical protein